jgi:hypothetical protein
MGAVRPVIWGSAPTREASADFMLKYFPSSTLCGGQGFGTGTQLDTHLIDSIVR